MEKERLLMTIKIEIDNPGFISDFKTAARYTAKYFQTLLNKAENIDNATIISITYKPIE